MNKVKTKDGVEIFYKDWARAAIVFSHGWPSRQMTGTRR